MLLALTLLSACGTPCAQLRQDRERFLARSGNDERPHVSLDLPFSVIDGLLQRQVDKLPDVPVPLDGAGRLTRYLRPLRLAARSLMLRSAAEGRVGLRLVLDLYYGKSAVVDVTLDVDLRPRLGAGGRELTLAIRPDDLRTIRPRLRPDAAERLVRQIRGQLPRLARSFVTPAFLTSTANRALELVVERGHQALRDGPLRRLGRIARLRFSLPAFPIKDVRIATTARHGGLLHLGILTSLPVREGLPTGSHRPSPRHATLRLSGAAAAEIANWAIAQGHAPGRFDEQGHPTPDGPFDAGLGWRSGARPLKVLLWKTSGDPCLRVRLGGRPELRREGSGLQAGATDVRVEEIRGPALYEFLGFFAPVFGPSFDVVLEQSASFEARIAGEELRFDVQSASVEGDVLRFEVAVREAGAARSR